MADQVDAHDTADRLGRLEAEQFDRRLRDRERQELQERWPRAFPGPGPGDPEGSSRRSVDLQTLNQLERLAQYQLAVQKSLAWRVAQALRKPFGRQW